MDTLSDPVPPGFLTLLSSTSSNEDSVISWKKIERSHESSLCPHLSRLIYQSSNLKQDSEKSKIFMHIGDPTAFDTLSVPGFVKAALKQAIDSGKYNGYDNALGCLEARQAVADYVSTKLDPVTKEDVFITTGASQAVDLVIAALANPGDNILLPRPGWFDYRSKAVFGGIKCRTYNLLKDQNWEVDLDHLRSVIDSKTAAIIVTNPSNPCGAVYTKKHLEDIVSIANEKQVPIVSDEVYSKIVYAGPGFFSMASSEPKVPLFICNSISKSFVVPGWGLGWLIVYNRYNALNDVIAGITQLKQHWTMPSTVLQGALPDILSKANESHFEPARQLMKTNVETVMEIFSPCPYLKAIRPQGAYYMMVDLRLHKMDIEDEFEFMTKLLTEENVFVLPGFMVDYKDAIRMVLLPPNHVVGEACLRIVQFCERHCIAKSSINEEDTSIR